MTSIIKVDQIQNAAGVGGLTIDSNGVIKKSTVPSWRLGLTAPMTQTAIGFYDVLFNQTSGDNMFLDGGCTLNSGVVTVPVSGLYQINSNIRFDSVGTGYILIRILINGNKTGNSETYSIEGGPPPNYTTINANEIYKLVAGDNVRIEAYVSADTSWSMGEFSTFSGAMIG